MGEGQSVLIVDDQPEGLLALEAILEPLGANLVRAGSGREALREVLARDFAVILLDVQMPEMDGFETATLIRERERSRMTPIVFLTAGHRSEDHVFRGYLVGAVDYVLKPVVPEILRSKVTVFVELARQTALARQLAAEQAALVADLAHKNEELAEAKERAERESRFKSQFLANMSHELRTPLNGIIGFTELMHNAVVGEPAPGHKEFLADVLTSARHLLRLINDILDLAKVEAGRMEFRPEAVNVQTTAIEIRDICRAMASKRRVSIDVAVDEALGEVVVDPAKLKQVLYNYLSNAIKFSHDSGRVSIRARPTGDGRFVVEVEDNGIGIAPEKIVRLFREFEQLDSSVRRKYQGTGLGLALTKRIVEAQGGRVGVKSEVGVGSVFWAELPRGRG